MLPAIASIGPVTSETLVENGYEPDLEAKTHDIPGLIAAVVKLSKEKLFGDDHLTDD